MKWLIFVFFLSILRIEVHANAIKNLEIEKKCHIKKSDSLYLFSGSMAATIYRLGLYDDPQIKGLLSIYEFKPTTNQKFAGGIYLSQKLAETIKPNSIIFLEESHDLESTIFQVNQRLKKNWTIIKIITKNWTPFDLSLHLLSIISQYLVNNKACKELLEHQQVRIKKYQQLIEIPNTNKKQELPLVYFFMGKWQGPFPEPQALIIYQEGFIQELIKHQKIAAYTEVKQGLVAHYATWSAKQLREKNLIFVGMISELKDSSQSGELHKVAKGKFQVTCFACLIPGIFQLEWLSRIQLDVITP